MADELSFDIALSLAKRLTLIPGFPRYEEAVIATAEDLVRWCRGAFIDGRAWSAEAQADWLVNEARLTMKEWEGTAELRQLFAEKFIKPVRAGNEFTGSVAGLPCVCGSGEKFKDCCQGKPFDLPDKSFKAARRPPLVPRPAKSREEREVELIRRQILELEFERRNGTH